MKDKQKTNCLTLIEGIQYEPANANVRISTAYSKKMLQVSICEKEEEEEETD